MDLTPDILRAAYAYLAETKPFVEWNLPDAEEVIFEVYGGTAFQARCFPADHNGHFRISVACKHVQHTHTIMMTIAHEVIHLHMFQTGMPQPRGHGKAFNLIADEVCREHQFDPGQF